MADEYSAAGGANNRFLDLGKGVVVRLGGRLVLRSTSVAGQRAFAGSAWDHGEDLLRDGSARD
jgi:hypothetical protein